MNRRNILITLCVVSLAFVGCSASNAIFDSEPRYSSSGTIILSRGVVESSASATYAPLLGYFPPLTAFVPAQNETWVKISRKAHTLTVLKGKSKIKEIRGEGNIDLEPGIYSLQFKQKDPSWYAPDNYFTQRRLQVPPEGDPRRFRRGALGPYALYPTATFAVHSGPVWTNDVGGFRVSRSDLSSVYFLLPLGAAVQVE